MLSGATCRASAIVGRAVLRMVVSSDSMKNATATSHGRTRFTVSVGDGDAIEPGRQGATSPAIRHAVRHTHARAPMARPQRIQDRMTFGGRLPWAIGLLLTLIVGLSLLVAFGDRHAGSL